MGGGSFDYSSYTTYSKSCGKMLDSRGYVTRGQTFESSYMPAELDPKNVIRECCNSKEHPNTLPVILALDVTGSMGSACQRTAEALGPIILNLLEKYKDRDIEFMIMGIGDVECDRCPIQASQFESDVRISKAIDKIYMEHGGGGNMYESYTAAWYFGLNQTKLDCYDKQGRKGVIITMGDEPLNPYLERRGLNEATGRSEQDRVETGALYSRAKEKFDIYHIAVDDNATCYRSYESLIKKSFGQYLGDNLKIATLNTLPTIIEDCIKQTIEHNGGGTVTVKTEDKPAKTTINENGEITW